MPDALLELTREQILAFRRRVGAIDERLPFGPESLRTAAWAGLQDSMPRAAALSIHARTLGTAPSAWEDPSLVQLWGPRFSAYAVAAVDRATFTLGRLPEDATGRRRAEDMATRLDSFLAGRRMSCREAGRAIGVHPNALRYGAPTGRILMRWDGARQPTVWTVPAPDTDPAAARRELVRRYLHVFGPTTAESFLQWAGIRARGRARAAFDGIQSELAPVRTPIGEGWILASDEAAFRAPLPAPARLLPSGDAFFLLWGTDRELLVPDAKRGSELWTSRVWPGAVLVAGELVGTWRRAAADLSIRAWRDLSGAERDAVALEAESMPLPGLQGKLRVGWG